jgi:collagenase-like PrtC family protease
VIATALALQNATKDAVHDEMVMAHASHLFHSRNEMDNEDFTRALFEYSAHLAAMTTTLVTNVLLTQTQLDEMIDTIKEMESMGKDIE